MTRMRVFLIMVAVFLLVGLLLLVLGESGAVDLHLYRAESSTQRSGQAGFQYPGKTKPAVSYDLRVFYDSGSSPRATHRHQVVTQSGPVAELEIDVPIIPSVSGNYRLPLYKSFAVEFVAPFDSATADADGAYRLDGEVRGSTEMTVVGLCSSQKALELARDEIVASVKEFLQDQLER